MQNLSSVIAKNIGGSFLFKAGIAIISLIYVPILLGILGPAEYGVWVVLSSFINWFSIADLGLGNGLRNKFSEAYASGDLELGRNYIEVAYGAIGLVTVIGVTLSLTVLPLINWSYFFNVEHSLGEMLSLTVPLAFGLFFLQLLMKNVTFLLLALQRSVFSQAFLFFSALFALFALVLCDRFLSVSLLDVAYIYTASPVLVLTILTVYCFKYVVPEYTPRRLSLQRRYLKDILGLGSRFFVIQLSVIVMFSSAPFLILHLYSPEDVASYNVVQRLFLFSHSLFSIVVVPYWSASTDAFSRQDYPWVRRALKRLRLLWLLFSIFVLVILFCSPYIYAQWIGDVLHVPYSLSAAFSIFVIVLSWCALHVQFINGSGKIRLQLSLAVIQLFSIVPLAIFLAKVCDIGPSGVLLATIISLLLSAIVLPIQLKKICDGNAQGIWNA